MNTQLKKLKDVVAESCVTIILNTHRTHPENQQDPIALKNLVKEASDRLLADEHKRDAKVIIERLEVLAESVDHNHNLESLILFVNEDIAEYSRLPISVEPRVVIDHTFATRDLVRAMHLETGYYVLVLSQQKTRLIEAYTDKVVQEFGKPFPIENNQFYSTNGPELSNASRQSNLMAEFFNRIDKEVNAIRGLHSLPVLICSEEGNFNEYLKIADQKHSLFETYLKKSGLDDSDHTIAKEAWEVVKSHLIEKNNARKAELLQAVSKGTFLSDTNDIYQAIQAGRVQTLFIEEGLFQPAVIEDGKIVYVGEEERNKKSVIDDIYDELIEQNMSFGGDVVFLPKGELTDFGGFGAITRY